MRSTVAEEEEDENEAHTRHRNELQGRSPEEHEGYGDEEQRDRILEHDCEPQGNMSNPFPRRRRGGGNREQRSLVDYNPSGPSYAAVRGNSSSGPSFARGNNSI